MGRSVSHSASSSIDSSSSQPPSLSSVSCSSSASASASASLCFMQTNSRRDLSTDLRLGLSISHNDLSSTSSTTPTREQCLDWPPIKHILRSSLAAAGKVRTQQQQDQSLFVKVYMEGIPIGRKLDLFAVHEGYNGLIKTLCHMFKTTIILCPDAADRVHSDKYHVLTYEDKEGDWMMVGDVPWEMFLTTVKRLKITRADRC